MDAMLQELDAINPPKLSKTPHFGALDSLLVCEGALRLWGLLSSTEDPAPPP